MLKSGKPRIGRMLKYAWNFAENFAELRAERAPFCPLGCSVLR